MIKKFNELTESVREDDIKNVTISLNIPKPIISICLKNGINYSNIPSIIHTYIYDLIGMNGGDVDESFNDWFNHNRGNL